MSYKTPDEWKTAIRASLDRAIAQWDIPDDLAVDEVAVDTTFSTGPRGKRFLTFSIALVPEQPADILGAAPTMGELRAFASGNTSVGDVLARREQFAGEEIIVAAAGDVTEQVQRRLAEGGMARAIERFADQHKDTL